MPLLIQRKPFELTVYGRIKLTFRMHLHNFKLKRSGYFDAIKHLLVLLTSHGSRYI